MMSAGQNHEALVRAHEVKMGADRNFGTVFAVAFAVIGIWPAITLGWRPRLDPTHVRWWSLVISATLLAVVHVHPLILRPFNRLWFGFGMLLSLVMTPIVMALLFVLAVIPTAIVMRLRGHDLIRLKLDRQAASYWILRTPPGPPGRTMKNQY